MSPSGYSARNVSAGSIRIALTAGGTAASSAPHRIVTAGKAIVTENGTYRLETARRRLEAGNAYAIGRSPRLYTEADVEMLVDEARSELRTERRKRK